MLERGGALPKLISILYGKFDRQDSTISHIGFILLALGIYSEQSIDSFIFYILQYVITNLNIFLIIIAFSYIINQSLNNNNNKTYFKDIIYISEFKGQYYSNPLIVLSFSICLFSMAGINEVC